MGYLLGLIAAFIAGAIWGRTLWDKAGDWFHRVIWGAMIALATCAQQPLLAQTLDSLVCAQCITDTVRVPHDSVGPTTHDTTYTVFRDSVILRDSTVPVPVPPPLPPPIGATPPTGFRLISTQDCRAMGWAGTGLAWVWRTVYVVGDAANATTPACEWRYGANYNGGTAPGDLSLIEAPLRAANLKELWVTGFLWVSPGWDGHIVLDKTLFVGAGWYGNQFFLGLVGPNQNPAKAQLNFQGVGGPIPGASCTAPANPANGYGCHLRSTVTFPRGQYVRMTMLFDSTSVTLWQNGRQVARVTGVSWRGAAVYPNKQFFWSKVAFNPTRGGTGDPTPAPQQLRWDQIEVWGK